MFVSPDEPPGCGAVDNVTILTTHGSIYATKRIVADPKAESGYRVEGYGDAKHFRFVEREVSCIDDLSAVLGDIEDDPHSFIVRGKPIEGINRQWAVRKLRARVGQAASLEKAARHWIALDIDSLEAPEGLDPCDPDNAVSYTMLHLPDEFRDVTCYYQFTGTAGLNPGIRLRLFFWSDRALEDWELEHWLPGKPLLDPCVFRTIQPIYTARPVFKGWSDPIPDRRSGIWRGERDFITPPAVIERKKRQRNYSTTGGGTGGGSGYEFHCSCIGDHEGGGGFNDPIKSAIAAWFAEHGSGGDVAWLRGDLERVIRAAGHTRDNSYIEMRVGDDLDNLISWCRERRAGTEEEATKLKYCDPTYPAPMASVEDARAGLRDVMLNVLDGVNEHERAVAQWQLDTNPFSHVEPLPPVTMLAVDVGTGKTSAVGRIVIPWLAAWGRTVVLAVPRHRLGDEIVSDLAAAGVTARVYRGREAADPEAGDSVQMCRDIERVQAIMAAKLDINKFACKKGKVECPYFHVCGYQRQSRERPQVWIVPHQLLFHARPSFIPQPSLIVIDESFWNAGLRGIEGNHVRVFLRSLAEVREVPKSDDDTADLNDISSRVYRAIVNEPEGLLRGAAMSDAGLYDDDITLASKLEWNRKVEPNVTPNMSAKEVGAACREAKRINSEVSRLAQFWKLLRLISGDEQNPYIELRRESASDDAPEEAVALMTWREDIRESWKAPTLIMDATMPTKIVRQFFPHFQGKAVRISVPMPHTYVRQVCDKAMTATMLIPTERANGNTNSTRLSNIERVRKFIEVRADGVYPERVFVVCQKKLEEQLKCSVLPTNVELEHFNNLTGENRWSDVALLIVIGRTEPNPSEIERIARTLFGRAVEEVPIDDDGNIRYPRVQRGIRLRDGHGVRVEGNQHLDASAEEVRWAICEAELVQAIGRGRGVNRTESNPLQIDILTNVVLPLEVDETLTWGEIQPTPVEIMRARGAVPENWNDMATAYPDLVVNGEAARKGWERSSYGQIPISELLIGNSPQLTQAGYKRSGCRQSSTLHYSRRHIPDVAAWLSERLNASLV